MKEESILGKEREELAKFLFDGDEVKAEALLTLLKSFTLDSVPSNLFSNLKMVLPVYKSPEDTCRWCHKSTGDCLFYLPDSMFKCEGKCLEYEEEV